MPRSARHLELRALVLVATATTALAACDKASTSDSSTRGGGATTSGGANGVTWTPSYGDVAGNERVSFEGVGLTTAATVTIGGAPCASMRADGPDTVSCLTPPGAEGPADVVVARGGATLAAGTAGFTYLPALALASVAPDAGKLAGGDRLTLEGHGFFAGVTVQIGDATCGSVSVASEAKLTCVTPATKTAGAYDVTVANTNKKKAQLASAFTYLAPPTLAALTPASGPAGGGTRVTLLGSGFRDGMKVMLGGGECGELAVEAADSATCVTPPGTLGAVPVTVSLAGGDSTVLKDGFTFVAAPSLAAVTPSSLSMRGGTQLTITGTGLDAGASVALDGRACTSVTIASATSLTCLAPAGAPGKAALVVTNADGQAATLPDAVTYLVDASPTVASVAPAYGPVAGGTEITITGANFLSAPIVTLDGGECTSATLVSATQIKCTTPAGTRGAKKLAIALEGGAAAAKEGAFTYVDGGAPLVGAVAPASGPLTGGTTITITGAGFVDGASVKIGGVACLGITVLSAATVTCTTPAGAYGAKDVVVTNVDAQAATKAGAFAYTNGTAPTVTTISPNFGPPAGNTAVRVVGAGFASGATVLVDGASCTGVSVVDSSTIDCTTPAGTYGAKAVVVRNPDLQQATLAAAFTYRAGQPPSLAFLAPNTGPLAGNVTVTLTGANFLAGATVQINGSSCASPTVVDATTVTCTVPAGSYGGKSVILFNPDGQYATLANGFTYTAGPAPTLATVDPNLGPAAGGTTLTVQGSGFQSGAQVTIGGVACASQTFVDATQLTCVTPSGSYGAKTVAVTNVDGQTVSLASGFTYSDGFAPVISAVYPSSGKVAGGTTMTLVGSAFRADAVVSVGGVNCTSPQYVSSTLMSCTVPAGASIGAKAVVLTNADGQASPTSGAPTFTYTLTPTTTQVVVGRDDNGRLGSAMVGLGDLTGDGVPEFAVAEPLAAVTVAGVPVAHAGEVLVYNGATGAQLCTVTAPTPTTDGAFGTALAAGEQTGDAYLDLVVGSPGATVGATPRAGSVFTYSGGAIAACSGTLATATLTLAPSSPEADAGFGSAVTTGNLDNDAFADVLVGEPYYNNAGTDQGRIWTFNGSTGATVFAAAVSPTPSDLATFGFSVALADMNGDGKDDLIVGEPTAPAGGNSRGRVYALSGADGTTQLFTVLAGAADNNRFGYAVAKVGRINGDAKDDIVVGEPYATTGQGKVYAYAWVTGATATQLWAIASPNVDSNSFFGFALAGTGDVDGDGRPDVLVGQPYALCGGTARGRVLVLGSVLGNALVNTCGTDSGAIAGRAVANVGDVNGDGLPDFVFGEPFAGNGGTKRGRATVYVAP
jgi:hypothetical protein